MFYISDLMCYIKFSSFIHCCQNVAGRPGSKSLSGVTGLFGADLETVVTRESLTGGVPGGVATSVTLATQAPSAVPIIIRRCVEEVERRGLDIIGRMDNNKCEYMVLWCTKAENCHVAGSGHFLLNIINKKYYIVDNFFCPCRL